MANDFERLTARQQKALQALLLNPSIREAAKEGGCSEASLWRWLQEEDFAEAYRSARSRLFENTLTALQAASTDAVGVLREVMADEQAPAPSRVTAAKAVLDLALKAKDALEVEERLRVLESLLEGAGKKARAA
jgi:hypothetical protein